MAGICCKELRYKIHVTSFGPDMAFELRHQEVKEVVWVTWVTASQKCKWEGATPLAHNKRIQHCNLLYFEKHYLHNNLHFLFCFRFAFMYELLLGVHA